MTRIFLTVLALGAMMTSAVHSQGARTFDAVSIREADPGTANGGMRLLPNGDIQVQNMRARNLIAIAHEIDAYRVMNAPEWTNQVSYDVVAKANAATKRPEIFAMMRTMLADRFRLTTRRETRSVEGFALVRASQTLGPGLKASAVNCEETPRETQCAGGGTTPNTMQSHGLPIANIVMLASGIVGAPIVDRTGLTGAFDIDLRWSTDAAPAADAPVLPTALQEQLGLKLQRERVPTEVLVIEHVERASEN